VAVPRLSTKTINVNHAQEDNSQTIQELIALFKISTTTMDLIISNVPVTKSEAHGRAAMLVDLAKLDLNQMQLELLVLLQDQSAAALKLLMPKINVNHAQEDHFQTKQELTALFKTSTTSTTSTTMDSINSNVLVTKSEAHGRAAMLVDNAKLEPNQMLQELLVLLQDQFAAVLKLLMPKINVNHAQEDNSQTNQELTALFKTSTTSTTMDSINSNVQVIKSEVHGKAALHAEAAQLELTQMLLEPIASDHKQFATVFKDNQLMDSNALTVVIDKLLTQPTVNNVLQLQLVLETTSISELVMLLVATNADHVLQDSLLLKTEIHATDQDQLATVSKDTLQMDTNAKTAKLVLSKILLEIPNVLLLQLVITTNTEELVMLQPAIDAKPVLYHLL
jgi:hypothetical protein